MYYFLYGLFYLLSLLPMRLLYVLSDFAFFVIFYLLKYRKDIVMGNLDLAFPEKTKEEKKKICKQFYHNLIDSFIETIKLISASPGFLEKRVTANWEALQPAFETGKSIQLHLGHTFNWEWGQRVLTSHTDYKILVVYMPITNAAIEKLMYKLRTKSGNEFIPASKMAYSMAKFYKTQYLLGLVADQSPGNLQTAYWLSFFGRPTPFVSGPEKGARLANIPVFFTSITKPRRGYYEAKLELATMDPNSLQEGELTLQYAQYMEKTIKKNPEMWLWSHRRWKHDWKERYEKNWVGKNFPAETSK